MSLHASGTLPGYRSLWDNEVERQFVLWRLSFYWEAFYHCARFYGRVSRRFSSCRTSAAGSCRPRRIERATLRIVTITATELHVLRFVSSKRRDVIAPAADKQKVVIARAGKGAASGWKTEIGPPDGILAGGINNKKHKALTVIIFVSELKTLKIRCNNL